MTDLQDDVDDDQPIGDLPDEESLSTSLRKALDSTPRLPRDRATVRLAMHYAELLDGLFDQLDDQAESGDPDGNPIANINRLVAAIGKIGPRYEATLDKLGMAPGARPATRGGDPNGVSPAASLLAYLQRGELPAGVDPGQAVDSAVAEALSGD